LIIHAFVEFGEICDHVVDGGHFFGRGGGGV
jgi:hypothetical protein